MEKDKKQVLDFCVEDIKYRMKLCEKSYEENNFNKIVSDFRAFVFSIGSCMDIIRNTVFEDYEAKNDQSSRSKYFSNIYDIKNNNICCNFKNYLNKKYTNQNKQEKIIETMKNLGKIISKEGYYFNAKKGKGEPILEGEVEGIKKFGLWSLYNSLKHSCYPGKPNTIAYFKDDILGYKGEMLLFIFDGEEKYYFEIFGGFVTPNGAEEYAKDKENPYIKKIKDIGNGLIKNLKALYELI